MLVFKANIAMTSNITILLKKFGANFSIHVSYTFFILNIVIVIILCQKTQMELICSIEVYHIAP